MRAGTQMELAGSACTLKSIINEYRLEQRPQPKQTEFRVSGVSWKEFRVFVGCDTIWDNITLVHVKYGPFLFFLSLFQMKL